MKSIVLRELRASRKSWLIWALGMFLMVAIGAAEYETVVENSEALIPVLEMLPRIVRVIFGMDILPVHTPIGYYACMCLWYYLVAFAHAAVLGATVIAKEERDRTVEFLFTLPYSRRTIITGKLIAAVLNVVAMALITAVLVLLLLVFQMSGVNLLPEIVLTMFGMFLAQLLCLSLGLFFSAVFQHHKTALSAAIAFIAGSYALAIVIEYVGNLDLLNFLTPFRYVAAPDLIQNGISPLYTLLSLVLMCTFTLVTYKLYEKRDLHC